MNDSLWNKVAPDAFRRKIIDLSWLRTCIGPRQADQLFADLLSLNCNPTAPSAPCIPFNYPEELCYARCSAMCHVMVAKGFSPLQVWVRQSNWSTFQGRTPYVPACITRGFPYHTAPSLCVRGSNFWSRQRMIFDPSFCTGPVSIADWLKRFVPATPSSWTIVYIQADAYYQTFPDPTAGPVPTDPGNMKLDADLLYSRGALQQKSMSAAGPPPYNCPP
ncbi:protein-glutamine glutaminase family protein [Burkholderia sp. Ac-20365]|uniref:protein-glutamine glutaminase family protein n=1 Tax=Burkholderia sp. Ac-20365 TaxID=2703897 RepID=UPI00197B1F6E|nr:protein-glutamine glutaminase family protein [Burkholderia sp. Ac-20365]MBN3761089.1 hypothetical protein [Burkholderia sp. Ac-20365]